MKNILVSLIDDHALFRNGLAQIIRQFSGYEILNQSGNGMEFIANVERGEIPDIAIIDIQMPVMNGPETAEWIKNNHPEIRMLTISMYDDEAHILKMIKLGVRGYLLKNAEPSELKIALDQIYSKNFYHSELVSSALVGSLASDEKLAGGPHSDLTVKEKEFLQFLCTDLTYKEIADRIGISVRTADSYRDNLFSKLGQRNRIGLVMFAIKVGLVKI